MTHVFSTVRLNVFSVATENTGGFVFPQDDFFLVDIDLQRVFITDAEGTTELNGEHDPP
jgi:hypothetical protein